MDSYTVLKILHILSAAVFFSVSCYVIYSKWQCNAAAFVKKCRHCAGWFILPSGLFQLLSGFTLLSLKHYGFNLLWVKGAFSGFLMALLGWFLLLLLLPEEKPSKGLNVFLVFIALGLAVMVFFMANKPS